MKYTLWIFVMFLAGCSVYTDGKGTGTATDTATATEADVRSPHIVVSGYIDSAFSLTVDGQEYPDSEDFYSAEMTKLQKQVTDAGYAGYAMQFSAQIGLNDLANGMHVYLMGENQESFAAQTQVESNGQFNVEVSAAPGAEMKVRANKRITVTLTSPKGQVVNFCYNFSAEQDNVPVSDQEVILSNFVTELTQYACDSTNSSTGINIPTLTGTGTSTDTGTGTGTRTAASVTGTVTATASGTDTSTSN